MIFFRKYNTLLVTGTTAISIPLIKRGIVDYAASGDWTPATGDVKVWIDGTAANITNLPAAINSGNSTHWEFILTAVELTGKQIKVQIVDSATKAVEDDMFIVETFGNASAMYPVDLSAASYPATLANTDHGGAAATLTLKSVAITNSAGNAVTLSSTGSNGHGLYSSGNGSGDGVHWRGGATGRGMLCEGGLTSGDGAAFIAQTDGNGLYCAGAVTGVDIDANITGDITGALSGNVGGIAGTTATLDALQTALDSAHGPGSWSTATGFAVAGDAMALTSGERTTLAASIWNALTSGMITAGSIGKRIIDYLTGDVFADTTNIKTRLPAALTSDGMIKADTLYINGTGQSNGDLNLKIDNVATTTELETALGSLQTHGDSTWATATGFSTLDGTQVAAAVLNATAADYDTAGSIGEKINSSGAAGDPLDNPVPGSYAAGTAGFALGEVAAVRVLGPLSSVVASVGGITAGTKIITYHHAPVEVGPISVIDADGLPLDMSAYATDLAFVVFSWNGTTETIIAQLNYPNVTVGGDGNSQITLANTTPLTATVGRLLYGIVRRTTNTKFVRAEGEFIVKPMANVT